MDLIHRDSSRSPFYNPQETSAQRINNAARRSIARVHRFSNIIHHITGELNDPNAPIVANNGEYLVNISLGTPPFPIVAIADTGSDIIWTQCKPCNNCYKQDAPVFDPKSSTTYRTVSCSSDACNSLQNEGTTPLFSDPSQPTFYFLQLQAISVGNKKIPFQSSSIASSGGSGGNIIIDSGTTLTLVPTQFLSQLSDALSEAVESQVTGGTKASDPQGFFSPCYVADLNIKVPPVTVHFQGADLAMTSDNIFIHVSDKIMCLAFYANDELSIYGNVAQQNFLIGYDLQKHTLSFKPTDCSKTTTTSTN
ncbi:Aspartic proteinase CDR1 [Linum perenne]